MQTLTTIETTRLADCEQVIARGLNTFVEVGNALIEIRTDKLYRAEFGTFEDYCLSKWNLGQSRAYQFMDAAKVIADLKSSTIVELPANEAQAREFVGVEPEHRASVWQHVLESAPNGVVTAKHIRETVEVYRDIHEPREIDVSAWNAAPLPPVMATTAYRHVSDDSYEWYTPQEYINAARSTMGGIHLDPASCDDANKIVGAANFYSLTDDGLQQPWHGTVYLNPPYSYPAVEQFGQKLIAEYNAGNVSQAVVLVNNCTDAAWFHELANAASCMCFTKGRVKYWGPNSAQARQGQVFFYLGDNGAAFKKNFAGFGLLVEVAP